MIFKVTNLKKVREMMLNLEPQLKKEVGQKATYELAKRLKQRIRNRYARAGYGRGNSSGMGHKSIIVKPTKKGAIVKVGVNAPWVVMFEQGVKSHWVSPYTIRKHLRNPGSTFGKKALKGEYGGKPIWWHWKGPFIKPAMETFEPQISRILIRSVNKAIRRAR